MDEILDNSVLDELDIDQDAIGKRDRHDYRVIMYSKIDVEYLEKQTMEKMLDQNPKGPYSDTFLMKSYTLFPEKYPELANKKKRGKKSTNYFIEDVGKWLWATWKETKTSESRNNFLTYCYPLIDGVIFKYQRHKHGLPYEEIFQSAILKIIQAMDKFDPARVVGHDEYGKEIYARVYTYFTMVLNYGITTITMTHGAEKLTNTSYEHLARSLGHEPDDVSDASIIYQEFLIFLDSIISSKDVISVNDARVYSALRTLLTSPSGMLQISVSHVKSIRAILTEDMKDKEILESLQRLKELFGPVSIKSDSTAFVLDHDSYS